jgi:8-oxo-dGTP pyrophosphatase MutT (NUDIX family)
MTLQEKIDILSMRFDIMWYKIWLEFPDMINKKDITLDICNIKSIANAWRNSYKQKASNSFIPYTVRSPSKLDFYIKKKSNFESTFLHDGGKRLRSLVEGTTNISLSWEIPKGRPNKSETALDCAIREFREETGIGVDMYNILFNIKPIAEEYSSMGIDYKHSYYIAYTQRTFEPSNKFIHGAHISEIDDVMWVDANKIKYIDNGRLPNLLSQVFSVINSRYKYTKCL